jgi:hypothetical protein
MVSLFRLAAGHSRAATRARQHRVKPVKFHVINILILVPHVYGKKLSWQIKYFTIGNRWR